MRNWWLALLAGLFPGLGVPLPVLLAMQGAATATSSGHATCGGDDLAPRTAQILTGYGKGGFPITTAVPQAQAFFDNGLQLGHAFAHKASIVAFQESARLDPGCAMCLWGEAWASGPTINYGKGAKAIAPLAAMTARAQGLAAQHGTDRERALIGALAVRYAEGGGAKQNRAFAQAMDKLASRYPQDDEIATIAADGWLIAGGRAAVWRSIALLEGVLRRDPDYTPAIHFYIHATEDAGVPARAEPYADRLARLAPSASHLVHMPSHTYYWIGRYQDAADANVAAVKLGIANAKRLGLKGDDGVWGLPYHAHNVHFGIGGAMLAGDAKSALWLADPLVRRAAVQDQSDAFEELIAASGYFAEGRFADPATVMALPEPRLALLKAYWHYARGEAQARLGNAAAVRAEAAAIPATIDGLDRQFGGKAAAQILRITRLVLDGRAAMIDDRPALALGAFRKATAMQEAKPVSGFTDPPVWWYPVRRSVAEAALAAGDARTALLEANTTLGLRPRDPVTLAIKARAEAALGQTRAAASDRDAAVHGWHGDPRLLSPSLA